MSDKDRKLKIGTRGSPLALAQTRLFLDALARQRPGLEAEVVQIQTSGDKSQAANTPLSEAVGGKAQFALEIEEALLAGTIDLAVHSMKDLPPVQPLGLEVVSVLPRADVRDVFISARYRGIEDLPQGAAFGTSSPRRAAIVLSLRPDLDIRVFRGNVATRIRKVEDGEVAATLLAAAGLLRLGLGDRISGVLDPAIFVPAAGQGAVGIEARRDDAFAREAAQAVNCGETWLSVTAERAFIRGMDGSCRTPLAAYMEARDPQGRARFTALAADDGGGNLKKVSYVMDVPHAGEAERLGLHAAREMKALRGGAA